METGAVCFTRARTASGWSMKGQTERAFWFPPPRQAARAPGSRPVLPPRSCQGGPCRVQQGGVGSGGPGLSPSRQTAFGGQWGGALGSQGPVRGGARAQLHPTQRFETTQLCCLTVLGSAVPETGAWVSAGPCGEPGHLFWVCSCLPSSAQPPPLPSRKAAPSLCFVILPPTLTLPSASYQGPCD